MCIVNKNLWLHPTGRPHIYIILMFIADLQSFDIFYLTIVVKRVVPHILSIAISLAYHACKFRPSFQEGFAQFLKFVPFI